MSSGDGLAAPSFSDAWVIGYVNRVLAVSERNIHAEMKRGLGVFATVASTAPLVGLVGNCYWDRRRSLQGVWRIASRLHGGYSDRNLRSIGVNGTRATCGSTSVVVFQLLQRQIGTIGS